MSPSQLAMLAGAPVGEVAKLLGELEAAGVFSRDEEGVIFSRRMVRDEAKMQEHRDNGKRGGNPLLTTPAEREDRLEAEAPHNPGVNPPDKAPPNPGVNPRDKAQIPDTRYQRSSSLRSEDRVPPSHKLSAEFETFWAAYPHKIGKAAARKAFAAARQRVDAASLMSGLDRYRDKRDDRPWCNPATWLNQERWSDEPAQAPPQVRSDKIPAGRKATAADVLFRPTLERLNGHDRDTEPTGGDRPSPGELSRLGN